MFVYLLFSLTIVTGCYAMVNKDEIRIVKITEEAKLEFGLKAALSRVKKQSETAEFPVALKEDVNVYLANRFEQLKSRTNPYDIFIYQNENPVGFLASHLDKDPSRIILDNFLASKSEDLSFLYAIALTHLQTIYGSKVTKVWFALIKYPASEHFAKKMGLEKTDYMDTFHDANAFQGWEKSFK